MVIEGFNEENMHKGNILQMGLEYFVMEQLKSCLTTKSHFQTSFYPLGLIHHPLKPVYSCSIRVSLHFLSCTVRPLQNQMAKSVGNLTASSGKSLHKTQSKQQTPQTSNIISYHRIAISYYLHRKL